MAGSRQKRSTASGRPPGHHDGGARPCLVRSSDPSQRHPCPPNPKGSSGRSPQIANRQKLSCQRTHPQVSTCSPNRGGAPSPCFVAHVRLSRPSPSRFWVCDLNLVSLSKISVARHHGARLPRGLEGSFKPGLAVTPPGRADSVNPRPWMVSYRRGRGQQFRQPPAAAPAARPAARRPTLPRARPRPARRPGTPPEPGTAGPRGRPAGSRVTTTAGLSGARRGSRPGTR